MGRAYSIQCDACGKAGGGARVLRKYLAVEEESLSSRRMPPRRHFCSRFCLGHYYTNMRPMGPEMEVPFRGSA
jgi:hypothetical protein